MEFHCFYHSNKVTKIKPYITTDISNIAGHYSEFPPKFENIRIMFNSLRFEYFIIGIADWGLDNCIDNKEPYRNFIGRGIVNRSPPGVKADKLIIMTALTHGCLMLTNDNYFKDHANLIPSESWFEEHQATFDIINGEFRIYLPE